MPPQWVFTVTTSLGIKGDKQRKLRKCYAIFDISLYPIRNKSTYPDN